MKPRSQRWILDALLNMGGLDVLHPESLADFEQLGYAYADIVRTYSGIKAGRVLTKEWTTTAQQVERKAQFAEERGYKLSARDLFRRAGLCYGRAQYTIFMSNPMKIALHTKMVGCYKKVMQYTTTPLERVEIPFEGKTLYCVLHLPGKDGKVPCVLLVPGMDMYKEDWHFVAQRYIIPRGMAAMSMDGPGQGESRLNGLTVTIDNYERAAAAAVDYLVKRPEINAEKIVLLGISMGSYYSTRIAAYESRLKGAATAMGCYALNNMDVAFDVAQPSYKANYMYMAGIPDEVKFDETVTALMNLKDIAPKVKCPFLMAQGEYDELVSLEDALTVFDLVKAPKELWLYEDEFHPLGGVVEELYPTMVDWLLAALDGKYKKGMDERITIGRDGSFQKGRGEPRWWPT